MYSQKSFQINDSNQIENITDSLALATTTGEGRRASQMVSLAFWHLTAEGGCQSEGFDLVVLSNTKGLSSLSGDMYT